MFLLPFLKDLWEEDLMGVRELLSTFLRFKVPFSSILSRLPLFLRLVVTRELLDLYIWEGSRSLRWRWGWTLGLLMRSVCLEWEM